MIKTSDILGHPDPLLGETSFPPGEGIGRSKPLLQASCVMGHDDRERRWLALQAMAGCFARQP